MGLSEYHVSALLQECQQLGFFRGAPRTVFRPVVYDDGDCSKDSPANLKTLLDVQETEACMYSGMARFEQRAATPLTTVQSQSGTSPC
eukprot:1678308-Amphidinium_carterae.2